MEFNIEWLADNEPLQRTDLFYCEGYHHSPVCIITGHYRKVLISCDGEMTIRYEANGQEHVIKDFWDLLENDIKTDDDLKKLDRDNFDDEPWFAAYDITNNYDEVAGHETYDDIGIIHDNLDEMINMVEYYIKKGEYND
jgi:hypothetical protein